VFSNEEKKVLADTFIDKLLDALNDVAGTEPTTDVTTTTTADVTTTTPTLATPEDVVEPALSSE
jgi:hypothetical protein